MKMDLSGVFACALALAGCDAATSTDAGATTTDAGVSGPDAASVTVDAAGGVDAAGSGVDAGRSPEICRGGLDEDLNGYVDCADPACWTDADCLAADVALVAPGLSPCGEVVEIDAPTSLAMCEVLMPSDESIPKDCALGSERAEVRLFCDAGGAPRALWIDEHFTAPRTMRMLSDRRFELIDHQHELTLDWERQESAAMATEGPLTPLHDTIEPGTEDTSTFRAVSLRAVAEGDVIGRLLGVMRVDSIIDLDAMSMETRTTMRSGGLRVVVTRP